MNLINKHFNKIAICLLLVIFVQQCNSSSNINSLEKKLKITNVKLDSVCKSSELKAGLEIEGLKAEKRMIQSTDRTMLDVNRQSEIDTKLQKLESSK